MNGEVSPEIQALHQVYLFHTFSTEELENILEHAEIASYHPGEKIYEVGDPARATEHRGIDRTCTYRDRAMQRDLQQGYGCRDENSPTTFGRKSQQ